ncbi:MAG: DUF2334 domain-containing protein [Lachnospiraceae bacterium]|nr:DUF2334 domain-containing protein [Lachnospiraceae bacterium]
MRKIAIRIDDVTPEMDWVKFHRFEKMLDKYQVCPLIGVVPENGDPTLAGQEKNPAFAEQQGYTDWLLKKKSAGWSIALHGCFHVYQTKQGGLFPLNHFSEFAGQPYREQLRLLRHGRERLKALGVESDIFMAPGHSFDQNTLAALKENGFRYVTDGYGSRPYLREGLVFLPISFLRSRERKKKDGYTTYVVHTWDMSEGEFRWYEDLFRTERERIIDYRELLQLTPQKRGAAGNLKEYLMAGGKRLAAKL